MITAAVVPIVEVDGMKASCFVVFEIFAVADDGEFKAGRGQRLAIIILVFEMRHSISQLKKRAMEALMWTANFVRGEMSMNGD